MIRSFKHKGLKQLFLEGKTSGLHSEHIEKIEMILAIIHQAKKVDDINFIGANRHRLQGNRKDIYAVTVRANWRITFKFENFDAYILDYEDYH